MHLPLSKRTSLVSPWVGVSHSPSCSSIRRESKASSLYRHTRGGVRRGDGSSASLVWYPAHLSSGVHTPSHMTHVCGNVRPRSSTIVLTDCMNYMFQRLFSTERKRRRSRMNWLKRCMQQYMHRRWCHLKEAIASFGSGSIENARGNQEEHSPARTKGRAASQIEPPPLLFSA